nr:nucleoside phosphorylase [Anaerolineae bacterium]
MTQTLLDQEGRQYHLQIRSGDIGRYVLLPGDPGRVPRIAAHLKDARLVAQRREYTTYTGTLHGAKVSVTSTGIGGPSTAIAVEELVAAGADTLIRVGTSGPVQEFVRPGDLCIAIAAVRDEGTTQQYVPLAFPAVADLDVTLALRDAARRRGLRHHVGVSHSKDSFYGEIAPERMPIAPRLRDRWQAWVRAGVICSEMEAAILFVVSQILGVRAGAIMLAITVGESQDELIRTAVEAVGILIERDRQASNSG